MKDLPKVSTWRLERQSSPSDEKRQLQNARISRISQKLFCYEGQCSWYLCVTCINRSYINVKIIIIFLIVIITTIVIIVI